MSTLAELQRLFGAVLIDGADADRLAEHVRGDGRAPAGERVRVYVDMYRLRLLEVLGEVYPRTAHACGEKWEALALGYLRAHPSRSPSLRSLGEHLAGWLAEGPGPCLVVGLAALEWARYDVFDALDEPPLGRERLAALGPENIAAFPLRRLSASRVVRADAALDRAWRALDEGGPLPASEGRPIDWLVWREGTTVYHRALEPDEAPLVAALEAGTSVGEVCEQLAATVPVEVAGARAFALIGRWVADALLVDPPPVG